MVKMNEISEVRRLVMNFEKKFYIRDKVFAEADIRALWQFVLNQKKSHMPGHSGIVIKNEGEIVSADDDTIFDTTSFRLKDIKQIEIGYHSQDYTSHISISIEVTNVPSLFTDNYVEIRGTSEEWVEATAAKLHGILEYVATTAWLTRMYLKIGRFIIPCVLLCVLYIVFMDCIAPAIRGMTIHFYAKFLIGILCFGMGLVCCWYLFDVGTLFLSVSIDVNGKRKKQYERLLHIIVWLVGTLLIPVALSVLSWTLSSQYTVDEERNRCDQTYCVTNAVHHN